MLLLAAAGAIYSRKNRGSSLVFWRELREQDVDPLGRLDLRKVAQAGKNFGPRGRHVRSQQIEPRAGLAGVHRTALALGTHRRALDREQRTSHFSKRRSNLDSVP